MDTEKLEKSWIKFQKLELMNTLEEEESSYYGDLAESHQVTDQEIVKQIVGDR